ncbi:MAG: hypothetical protein H7A38_00625 [Chlamydiales bacterium]|nr:hypothetical protein [Chlamydiales bacterium]
MATPIQAKKLEQEDYNNNIEMLRRATSKSLSSDTEQGIQAAVGAIESHIQYLNGELRKVQEGAPDADQAERITKLQEGLNQLREQKGQVEQELAALKESSAEKEGVLREELEKVRAQLPTVSTDAAPVEEENPLQAQIQEKEGQLAKMQEEHQIQIDTLKKQLDEATPKLDRLEAIEQKLTERIGELEKLLAAAKLREDNDAHGAELKRVSEQLDAARVEHQEALKAQEKQLREARQQEVTDLTGKAETAEKKLQAEIAKVADLEAKLAVNAKVAGMTPQQMRDRQKELGTPEKGSIEAYELGLINTQLERIDEAVGAKAKEMSEAAAKLEAQVQKAELEEAAKEVLEQVFFAPIDERLKQVQQQLKETGEAITALGEKSEENKAQLDSLRAKQVDLEGQWTWLVGLQKKAKEIKVESTTNEAFIIKSLSSFLPEDVTVHEHSTYIFRAVQAIVDIQAKLKENYDLKRCGYQGINKLLHEIVGLKEEYDNLLRNAVEAAGVQGEDIDEKRRNLVTEIEKLKVWADRSKEIYKQIGSSGDEQSVVAAFEAFKNEMFIMWLSLVEFATPRPFAEALVARQAEREAARRELEALPKDGQEGYDAQRTGVTTSRLDFLTEWTRFLEGYTGEKTTEGEAVLAHQRDLLAAAQAQVERLPREGVDGYDADRTARAQQVVRSHAERVRLLEVLTQGFATEKAKLEWEKGIVGSFYRLFWNSLAMLWSISRFAYDGWLTAGSLLYPKPKTNR